jgi:hypothetical protein
VLPAETLAGEKPEVLGGKRYVLARSQASIFGVYPFQHIAAGNLNAEGAITRTSGIPALIRHVRRAG